MRRLRTINQTFEEIRQADPDTCLTRHAIRTAVINGEIPSRLVGSRRLIDMDLVLAYFSGDEIEANQRGGRVDG